MDEQEKVVAEINSLIKENVFPLGVIHDVYTRINDCDEVGYLKQQLRYLQHFKSHLDKNKLTEVGN